MQSGTRFFFGLVCGLFLGVVGVVHSGFAASVSTADHSKFKELQ